MIAKALRVSALLLLAAACSSTADEATLGTSGAGGAGGAGTGAAADLGAGDQAGVSGSDLGDRAQAGTQQDFEVNVGDRVFFGYDGTTLDDTARKTLERQAAWLQQFPGTAVSVEGHTDERGTREYNLALGERRASAAQSYLTTLGVDGSRVQVTSYGEERPADPGHDENAYALNRRAVTVVNVTQ